MPFKEHACMCLWAMRTLDMFFSLAMMCTRWRRRSFSCVCVRVRLWVAQMVLGATNFYKLNSILDSQRLPAVSGCWLRLHRACALLFACSSLLLFFFLLFYVYSTHTHGLSVAFVRVFCSVFCFGFFILCAVFFVDLFSLYVLLTLSAWFVTMIEWISVYMC